VKLGRLDRRITIERNTPVDDGHQTRLGDWVPIVTAWAQYLPGRGSERRTLAAERSVLPVTFRVRWSPMMAGVLPTDRVIYPAPDGPVHEIVAPLTEIGRREGLEIICAAVTGG